MWYLAQGVGVIAMVLIFISFQCNSKKKIALFQMGSSAAFCAQYILLMLCGEDALTGAVLSGLNIFKCIIIVFSDDPKNKWASMNIWVPAFCVINIVAGILTWTTWIAILPILANVFATIAFYPKKASVVRLLYIPASPCWIMYNALTGALPGILSESFNLISLTVAFIRFDILHLDKLPKPGDTADDGSDDD